MIKKFLIPIVIVLFFFGYPTFVKATSQQTTISEEGIKLPKDTYTKLSQSPNKNFIVLEILQAKQKIGTGEVQKQMDSMNKKVQELTKWATTKDQKLSRIYERILTNISYDKNRQNNMSTFYDNSIGILSYRNKKWICGGIAHIFWIMAFYAGETDIKHEEGTTLDRNAHVWLKIGNFYYDPTFDIYLRESKVTSSWQYYYFKLPKNVIALDRNTTGEVWTSVKEKIKQANALLKIYKEKYPIIWFLLNNW